MAPIKFEEHIKEKLDQREITPSAGSWDKLNRSLNEAEGEKKKFNWWIPSVAAVIVLMICGFLFSDLNKDQGPQIVDTKIEEPSEEIENQNEVNETEIASEAKEVQTSEQEKSPKIEDKKIRKTFTPAQNAVASSEKEEVKTSEDQKPANKSISITSIASRKEEPVLINKELEGMLAEVSESKASGEAITNAEVDSLLARAARKISNQNIRTSGKVNPNALLADVEEEVYESFKEKVFEMVKTGYQKAAVAVSNKLDNNQ